MLRFSVLFIIIIVSLFALEIYEPVRQAVILPFTSHIASFSSWIVQMFDPNVVAANDVIQNKVTGHAVKIAAGCNGVEALIILFAALMAFKSPWLYKLKGMIYGFIAIQALNTVRIISLFYLLQWDKTWFDWFHLYLWQALIIMDALVVWLIWLRYLPKNDGTTSENLDSEEKTENHQK